MNTVASLISGQFTRTLILGSFFPVVLFLFLGYVTVNPLLPGWQWVLTLRKLDTQSEVGVFVAAAIVATIFLYTLNTPVIRFLEGYPWKGSRYGRARIVKFKAEHEAVTTLLPKLRALRAQWDGVDKNDAHRSKVQEALNRLQELLNTEYPSKPSLILPTRFGNVLRSFETYPLRQYRMDGVTLWSRIVHVVPKESLEMVEDARSSLDVFVNCGVLSAVMAAVLFTLGCCVLNGGTPRELLAGWAAEVVATAAGALLFIASCPSKIAAWGGQVKSIFDLYRGDLLKKMGYMQVFSNREEERSLWGEISRQIIYGDPIVGTPHPYVTAAESRTAVSSDSQAALEITGGVKKKWGRRRTFHYRLLNNDTKAATNVVLIERLMDGYGYIWGSLTKDGSAWELTGANPYSIKLGNIDAGKQVELEYCAFDLSRRT